MEFKTNYEELQDEYQFRTKYLTSNMNKINYVVTHGHCTDGFMSETIIRKWMVDRNIDLSTVTFLSGFHGTDYSNLHETMKDKFVIICDFSFSALIYQKMIDATHGNILILDHHKTASLNLKNIDPEFLLLDMKHSGAFLTWTYFNGFTNIPKSILYVEDYDLFKKQLPNTNEFSAFSYGSKFEYDEYIKFLDNDYRENTMIPTGKGMLLQNNIFCEQLAKKCIPHFMKIGGRYYFVACLNSAGILRSEVGSFVLTKFPHTNFSFIYAHDPFAGSTTISYRSMDDRTDTTQIASLHGGGGHRNASGGAFPFKIDHPPGRVIDDYRLYFTLNNLEVLQIYDYRFLILNTSYACKHIVQYLMQERFFGDEASVKNKERMEQKLVGYQEGMYIIDKNNDENNDKENNVKDDNDKNENEKNQVYNGAVAWYVDNNSRYQAFIKCLPNTILENQLKLLLENDKKEITTLNSCYVQNFKVIESNFYHITFSGSQISNLMFELVFDRNSLR